MEKNDSGRRGAAKEKWDLPVSRKVYDEVMGIARGIAEYFDDKSGFNERCVKYMIIHGEVQPGIAVKSVKTMCMALLPYVLKARERSRRARERAELKRKQKQASLAGCVEGAGSEGHGQVGRTAESGIADDGKHLLTLRDGGDAAVEVVVGSGVSGKDATHGRDDMSGIDIVERSGHGACGGGKFKDTKCASRT